MKDTDGRWLRRKAAVEADLTRSSRPTSDSARVTGGPTRPARPVVPADIRKRIGATAFAFRGFDVENLGRSAEFLDHRQYGPVVRGILARASAICSEAVGAPVDLVDHIRAGARSSLAYFPQDVATIVAMEIAQIALLEEFFGVPTHSARLSIGYSIGEMAALVFGGVFTLEQLLPVPLELAPDCAELANDLTMGILFTRGPALHMEDVERLCRAISSEGKGLIGPSAYLSPNTALILGQGDTLDRLDKAKREYLPEKVMLRRNPNHWPPLHSPLVWQRLIPNRTALKLYQIEGGQQKPVPTILSCITGEASYAVENTRELLIDWTDHPQRLWDVIDKTLAAGVEAVIHVGPSPNLIPATFTRLSNNVSRHLGNKYLHMLGRGVVSGLNHHAWLARLLPSRTSLLRAPYLTHVILEDWLLEQAVEPAVVVAFPENNAVEGVSIVSSDTIPR